MTNRISKPTHITKIDHKAKSIIQ